MFKRKPKSQEPESTYKAAQRRALEKQRRNPLPEPPDPKPDHKPDQSKPKRRRRPWEKPPDALFWSPDDLILFPLADDDEIIIVDSGEIRRFAEPSYDAQGRRLYPSSIKSLWQQTVIVYFILGLILGAILCYIFAHPTDCPCWF